ncbi:MAG: hypothetical protein BWY61_02097 [Firmicutes bacterium ADurb.Bin354]|nr:MAG: hypothetical protein BWY61_02097 [Firmicutes bacterium ADurb.Bin354]
MRSYFSEKINVVKLKEPVCVVNDSCLVLAEFNESAHLLFEAFDIVSNSLFRKHLTHICFSGRITDHTGTAAKKGDRLVSCALQSLHKAKCHEMTYMKTVRRRIETDIKYSLTAVYKLSDLSLICCLCYKASGL